MAAKHPAVIQQLTAPQPKSRHRKWQRLLPDDQLFVLWGLSRGWSFSRIGQEMHASRQTVARYVDEVFRDPGQVFLELPVLKPGKKARESECGFCGENRPSGEKAMRHVLAHVLPYERARDADLSAVKAARTL